MIDRSRTRRSRAQPNREAPPASRVQHIEEPVLFEIYDAFSTFRNPFHEIQLHSKLA
jgi:hypothetical protein